MGTISSGILGGFSGKVGPVTGSSWKGVKVIKSRPDSVSYPGTAGQVAQTSKMRGIVSFSRQILSPWIKPLWDRAAVQMSGYNAFVKANIAVFVDGVISDYSALVMSRGTMAYTPIDLITLSPARDSIALDWDPEGYSGLQLASDIAYAIVVMDATSEAFVSSGVLRSEGQIKVEFPESMPPGSLFHCYLAFKRANGTVISNSYYESYTHIPV